MTPWYAIIEPQRTLSADGDRAFGTLNRHDSKPENREAPPSA